MIWLFLSSGLFLGWSLGANGAATIFGTAVATRMIRFGTAAVVAGLFVVIGSVAGVSGTAGTLDELGGIDAPAGAFGVALAAGLSLFLLLRQSGFPISTSQSIVGAIVGWNLYTGHATDPAVLSRIVSSWFFCPLLAGAIAALFYLSLRAATPRLRIHLLEVDALTRVGLLLVGAFGAFSLGQNNIAIVMGVFLRVSPFPEKLMLGPLRVSSAQMLFLAGGLAIAAGIATYSQHSMRRLGSGLTKLSPLAALIVVGATATVLWLFASPGLAHFLRAHGLPALPLVPVSSSQAAVGAILGISLVRRSPVRWRSVGEIVLGWVLAPVLAALISFIGLFVLANVFLLPVATP